MTLLLDRLTWRNGRFGAYRTIETFFLREWSKATNFWQVRGRLEIVVPLFPFERAVYLLNELVNNLIIIFLIKIRFKYLRSQEERQNCWQFPCNWSPRRCKSQGNRCHLVRKWSCECLPASTRRHLCTIWEPVAEHRSLCTPSWRRPRLTIWRANSQEISVSCSAWEWLVSESRKWCFDRDRWKQRTSTRPVRQWISRNFFFSNYYIAFLNETIHSLDRRIRVFAHRDGRCQDSPWQLDISRSPPPVYRPCTKRSLALGKYWLRNFER